MPTIPSHVECVTREAVMVVGAMQTTAAQGGCNACSSAIRVATYGEDLPNSSEFFELHAKTWASFHTDRVRTPEGHYFGGGGSHDWNRGLSTHQLVTRGFSIDVDRLPPWASSIIEHNRPVC